ncbi:MAG: hypothetical protein IKL97_02125 [Eggerthellaceae bacterium]|nr:hypothetical protein [Eggerthellaceae bacterium]
MTLILGLGLSLVVACSDGGAGSLGETGGAYGSGGAGGSDDTSGASRS